MKTPTATRRTTDRRPSPKAHTGCPAGGTVAGIGLAMAALLIGGVTLVCFAGDRDAGAAAAAATIAASCTALVVDLGDDVDVDVIDRIYEKLGELQIDYYDSIEEANRRLATRQRQEKKKVQTAKKAVRSNIKYDDPVRMYLKQMGQVPLLTREQEVEISKRIEEAEINSRKMFGMFGCATGAYLNLIDRLDAGMCRLKIGKEMFTRSGSAFVEQVVSKGFDVFLDLKFHDIPNTVARACDAAAALDVWMVNLHASGGSKMMVAAREALDKAEGRRPLLIAVTVLTSMGSADLLELGLDVEPEEQVSRLAALAKTSGLDGVVCSPREAAELRAQAPQAGGVALVVSRVNAGLPEVEEDPEFFEALFRRLVATPDTVVLLLGQSQLAKKL